MAYCSLPILWLSPLANNGGFTQTMVLGAGSPAIDAGNNATCASTDQRGVKRPQGPHCDMGAYEAPVTRLFRPPLHRTAGSLKAGRTPTSAVDYQIALDRH